MNTSTDFSLKAMSVQFTVSDLERSIAFYTQKLGFAIDFRYEDFYAGLTKDGCSIHLKSSDSKPPVSNNGDDLDILFSVAGIDDIFQALLEKDVKIHTPLRDMPYGKEFYIEDPDGHIMAIIETS